VNCPRCHKRVSDHQHEVTGRVLSGFLTNDQADVMQEITSGLHLGRADDLHPECLALLMAEAV
jgi:hypothetical protein